MLYELGPDSVQPNLRLKKNPGAWNFEAGLLFMDQPIGTGFSPAGAATLSSCVGFVTWIPPSDAGSGCWRHCPVHVGGSVVGRSRVCALILGGLYPLGRSLEASRPHIAGLASLLPVMPVLGQPGQLHQICMQALQAQPQICYCF